ncbi:ribose 5-phosphate isomerase B [Candidatus Woesearchaeota archaeon]|nr:ribose 5-phosphate isomerase B [Candidatus Woesearchaeota archaeon]
MKEILIGADHAGFRMKESLKKYLAGLNIRVKDYGTNSEESTDYPPIAGKLARDVARGKEGILICGSGIGMSIAANKIHGVRAAVCHNEFTAQVAKEHNHANVLCLGARDINEKTAKKIVKKWLKTAPSTEERHKRRVNEISDLEC